MSTQKLFLEPQLAELVADIRGLHQLFEHGISQLRLDLDRLNSSATPEDLLERADYWQVVIAYDSAVRLRLIIENNFVVIETLGLLATVRYVFELLVWLRLAIKREQYAIAYYGRLLEKSVEHSEAQVKQLNAEIDLLQRLDAQDNDAITDAVRAYRGQEVEPDAGRARRDAMADIDRRAARMFSLYADRGRTLGYGYTAHLVQTQALPKAISSADNAKAALTSFRDRCPTRAKALLSRRWKWDREAREAGMSNEYFFLYSYVSRFLHATPASVTTDEKNLEPDEIVMFLRYIRASLLDIQDLYSLLRTTREQGGTGTA